MYSVLAVRDRLVSDPQLLGWGSLTRDTRGAESSPYDAGEATSGSAGVNDSNTSSSLVAAIRVIHQVVCVVEDRLRQFAQSPLSETSQKHLRVDFLAVPTQSQPNLVRFENETHFELSHSVAPYSSF